MSRRHPMSPAAKMQRAAFWCAVCITIAMVAKIIAIGLRNGWW